MITWKYVIQMKSNCFKSNLFITAEAEKTGSDIIERITESRRLRHEAAVEDLHQDLTVIANVSTIRESSI